MEWKQAGPPPARRSTRPPREDRDPASRPPTPLPLEPVGTPPPQGMAWPPPEGDPTICQLRETSDGGRSVLTKCGRLIILQKGESQFPHVSAWHGDVTCKRCKPDA
jgi:hypothetical protein